MASENHDGSKESVTNAFDQASGWLQHTLEYAVTLLG